MRDIFNHINNPCCTVLKILSFDESNVLDPHLGGESRTFQKRKSIAECVACRLAQPAGLPRQASGEARGSVVCQALAAGGTGEWQRQRQRGKRRPSRSDSDSEARLLLLLLAGRAAVPRLGAGGCRAPSALNSRLPLPSQLMAEWRAATRVRPRAMGSVDPPRATRDERTAPDGDGSRRPPRRLSQCAVAVVEQHVRRLRHCIRTRREGEATLIVALYEERRVRDVQTLEQRPVLVTRVRLKRPGGAFARTLPAAGG